MGNVSSLYNNVSVAAANYLRRQRCVCGGPIIAVHETGSQGTTNSVEGQMILVRCATCKARRTGSPGGLYRARYRAENTWFLATNVS